MDSRNCQTSTATPAEPGELPWKLGSAYPTAIMCSEAVPWRCHRSLIADSLTVQGARVMRIFTPGRAREHTLTSFARVEGFRITYPDSPRMETTRDR